jgi:dihydrofolate reductase
MKITLISAVAANRVIGLENDLPWKLPSDLAHFKRTTLGYPMLMGRKTFESFGTRPLPKRPHIILSRSGFAIDPQYQDQVFVVRAVQEALDCAARLSNKLFVIGGATIYEQLLPMAHTMILSELDDAFVGDAYFPEWNRDDWYLTSEITPHASGEIGYRIRNYIRRG